MNNYNPTSIDAVIDLFYDASKYRAYMLETLRDCYIIVQIRSDGSTLYVNKRKTTDDPWWTPHIFEALGYDHDYAAKNHAARLKHGEIRVVRMGKTRMKDEAAALAKRDQITYETLFRALSKQP